MTEASESKTHLKSNVLDLDNEVPEETSFLYIQMLLDMGESIVNNELPEETDTETLLEALEFVRDKMVRSFDNIKNIGEDDFSGPDSTIDNMMQDQYKKALNGTSHLIEGIDNYISYFLKLQEKGDLEEDPVELIRTGLDNIKKAEKELDSSIEISRKIEKLLYEDFKGELWNFEA